MAQDNVDDDSIKNTKPNTRKLAKVAFSPAASNAMASKRFINGFGAIELSDAYSALRDQQQRINSGDLSDVEGLLLAQSITLNSIFTNLAQRAQLSLAENVDAADRYLRLAFKAQAQSVKTLEALVAAKNPPAVSFVKQTNIGNAVQVNNSTTTCLEKSEPGIIISQNELLDSDHGERLEYRTTETAGRENTKLESMVKINRPND